MRRATLGTLVLLALPACDASFCPDQRLTAPSGTPAWAVRYHDVPDFAPPPMEPGEDPLVDPPGMETYAAITLYDAAGTIVAERWLDTLARWEGAAATVTAAARFASVSPPGRLTLLLADARRPRAAFSVSDGSVLQVPSHLAPPEVGGQLVDSILVDSQRALVTRRRGSDGGGDLLLLNLEDRLVLRRFDLTGGSGPVEPGRIAALEGERFAIGLRLLDEPSRGALAVVSLETETVGRVEVPSLAGCWEVAAMARDPAAADEGRVAVFCEGHRAAMAEEATGLGFAILRARPGQRPELSLARVGDPTTLRFPPTNRLVPLTGDWIAVVSRGDATVGRDDALLAFDLTGEGTEVLWQERPSDQWGDALGEGDFGGGELWWPSVTGGILRWRVDGTGADARFDELDVTERPPRQACGATPARDIRYLRAP